MEKLDTTTLSIRKTTRLEVITPTGKPVSKRIGQAIKEINRLRKEDTFNPDTYWIKRLDDAISIIAEQSFACCTS